MKKFTKDYPEAEAVIYALDGREEDAKEIIKGMGMDERRRFQEALMAVSYLISEVNAGPARALSTITAEDLE
jgi:hypothetical protein